MSKMHRLAGAVVAPLLIAGCGMPIGVQIASLLADTMSIITTDKTLTDHGISAVYKEDCALWRTVEGKNICRKADDSITTLADASSIPVTVSIKSEYPERNRGATAETVNKNITRLNRSEFPTEEPATAIAALTSLTNPAPEIMPTNMGLNAWAPVEADELALETSMKEKIIAVMRAPTSLVYPQSMLEPTLAARPAKKPVIPVQPVTQRTRQTFLIIASYHYKVAASRFSRKHSRLKPTILEGIAHGKRVYRVAIGPVARGHHKTTRQKLKNRGFKDAWALTIKLPRLPTEVAALR